MKEVVIFFIGGFRFNLLYLHEWGLSGIEPWHWRQGTAGATRFPVSNLQ